MLCVIRWKFKCGSCVANFRLLRVAPRLSNPIIVIVIDVPANFLDNHFGTKWKSQIDFDAKMSSISNQNHDKCSKIVKKSKNIKIVPSRWSASRGKSHWGFCGRARVSPVVSFYTNKFEMSNFVQNTWFECVFRCLYDECYVVFVFLDVNFEFSINFKFE